MTQSFTLRERLRYRMDNALARGVWMVLLWLGVLTALFVILVAGIIWLTGVGPGDSGTSLYEGIWLAITRSLDPGTFSGDEGNKFRIGMLVVTLIGIFLGATIIGIISSGIDSRLEELRRGRSAVVEFGHTLIVGRSDKLNVVIAELVEANRSERGRAIVVLTPDDPVEVTDEIRRDVKDLGTSRLVVRSGSPTRINDLARANPQNAKSVIVLNPEGDGARAYLVKVVLGLNQLIPATSTTTIVAEAEDAEVAEALKEVVGDRLITVVPSSVVARITAQVSRTAGLGAIYQEILDFDGDEMYAVAIPERWVGTTFGQLTMASSSATIIGLETPEGSVFLNPSSQRMIAAGDRVIGIAEDDSTFILDRESLPWSPPTELKATPLPSQRERTLIIGWSGIAQIIVQEIETHVAPGSELIVLVDPLNHDPANITRQLEESDLSHQIINVRTGNTISRGVLAEVLADGPYDHVLILCERALFDVEEADARVLLSLMHVRALDPENAHNVIAELIDPNDVELGRRGDSDEFIVSQQLISLLLTQLSESPHLADVFADLFDGAGTAIALHPIERYVGVGETDFDSVVAEVRNWGVVAIGYRAAAARSRAGALAGGIRVNPPKSERITFAAGDMIAVIVNTKQ
jgi:hypothetical protein